MTNWRQVKITSKSPNSSWIRFYLDGSIRYSNGSESYVDTKNRTPFDTWQEGTVIEIDTDRACNYSSGYEHPDTSVVRQSMAITPFSSSGSSVIPSGIRQSFLSNVSDAYQSGEDFQAFIEQRNSSGRTDFQWYGASRDGKFQQGGFDRRR